MNFAAVRLAPWLLGALVFCAGVPARAGLLDGLFGGSDAQKKASSGQRVWVVREFSEIRLVPREPGSTANQHPAQVDSEALRQQLGQIRYVSGNATPSLFARDEAAELAEALAQALGSARPDDDVLLLSSARRSDAVLLRPVAVTARLFVQSGSLQFIVNDARYEFFDKMRGSNQPPEFTFGSRTRTGSAVLRAEGLTSARADWLAMPLTAVAAAPAVPMVPAAKAPPAPATPAPAPALRPRDPGFAEEVEQRLTTLKRLRERGLITEEEYQQKRKEILQLL